MRNENHIKISDKDAVNKVADLLKAKIKEKTKISIVCIGTDMCIGDSLGPLVGTILKDSGVLKNVQILGTLEKPVHAINLHDKIKEISKDSFVIAVDACIGSEVDTIQVKDGPIKPGIGVGKDLVPIGDISLLGVLYDRDKIKERDFLNEERLGKVYSISKIICQSLYRAFK